MEFRIADTFTGALAKTRRQEQKAAKTTAFDLQIDPSRPGLQFHRIDKSKDTNFWSVRVNADIRIVVHRPRRACCSATSTITIRLMPGPSAGASRRIRDRRDPDRRGARAGRGDRAGAADLRHATRARSGEGCTGNAALRRSLRRRSVGDRRADGLARRRQKGDRGRILRSHPAPAGGGRRGAAGILRRPARFRL